MNHFAHQKIWTNYLRYFAWFTFHTCKNTKGPKNWKLNYRSYLVPKFSYWKVVPVILRYTIEFFQLRCCTNLISVIKLSKCKTPYYYTLIIFCLILRSFWNSKMNNLHIFSVSLKVMPKMNYFSVTSNQSGTIHKPCRSFLIFCLKPYSCTNL